MAILLWVVAGFDAVGLLVGGIVGFGLWMLLVGLILLFVGLFDLRFGGLVNSVVAPFYTLIVYFDLFWVWFA